MLEIFTKAFFLKKKLLLKLEAAFSDSFKCYKLFFLKMKKESLKRCEPPLKQKNSSHNKRYKKDIEKGEKWKTKSIRKV